MHQIYQDVGLLAFLSRLVAGNFHFHLFTNNVTPDRSTVLAGLTEIAGIGAPIITVAAADFTLSGVAGHVGSFIAAPIAFLNDSGAPIDAYGYFVTDVTNAILFAAARFDGAPVNKINGESWLVTPIVGDFSQFAS